MAAIMTKQGNLDNIVTYEHICDTFDDIQTIDPHYITLGSTCVVINGESGGLEVYMANSEKEWMSLSIASDSGEGSSSLGIQILGSNDYDSETGVPDISEPLENIFYLVPSNDDSNNMYNEWVYVNNNWELFGSSGNIDISNKVDKIEGKGLSTNDYTTAEKNKLENIEAGAQVNTLTGVKGNSETEYRVGNVNITKANIGLGNVDNTSDLNKPVSLLQQQAIDAVATKTVEITNTDVIITGVANTRYVCGTLSTLNFIPPAEGIVDIIFTSGSSKTILTLPNTVKMPDWFEVEANMTYEISIADGVYGVVTSWAV